MMRLPDFIIGGAPRSGTTWLYEMLDRHPRVRMARPLRPEPKFFLVDEEYEQGLDYYSRRWFADIESDVLAGEKTTNYLESEAAACRIAHALPDVRLVFALREPVARAISNYRWSSMNGFETEPLRRALELEEEREAAYAGSERYSRPFSYFSRGLYARLLMPYFDRFPREQILCLRYEDIASDPRRVAGRVHEFLGVEPRGGDAEALGVINPSDAVGAVDDDVVIDLRERYREPNRELAELLGPDFEVWSS